MSSMHEPLAQQVERLQDQVNRLEISLSASQQAEEFYRHILQQTQEGVIVLDQALCYRHWNRAMERMLGLTAAEVLGKHVLEVFPQASANGVYDLQQRALAGETSHTDDLRFVHPLTGAVQWHSASHSPLRNELGMVMGVSVTVRDVTAQKEADARLAESEERFRSAIQAMREGFVLQNHLGEIVVCNPSAERILGLTADQMMGLTSLNPRWRTVHEDGSDFPGETHPTMITLHQGIAQHDVLMGVQRSSGEWAWVSVNSVPVWHEDKMHGVVATFTDITERKQAELALRESEERFRSLVDSLPLIIWMTNASGENSFFNRFWKEFTGYSYEEAQPFGWQEMIHPDDLAVVMEGFVQAVEARQPYQAEFRVRRHDGQYRWVLDSCQPRFALDGRFLGYIGSGLDITDRKMMLSQIEEASKLESLGRLAGGIAHDFNNMLTAITGYTDLAQMEVALGSDIALYLGNVQTSAERAAALTRQLLMYARRQMVEFRSVNLNEVILMMEPLLRRMAGEAYELVILLSETVWSVLTNASQMEQVLLNLIINARDAMPNGGRILVETENVTLDAEYAAEHVGVTPGEYVRFTVSDSGAGMSPNVKERIFEPFFTTKEMGKGTGLGLATCYGIVKQSRGNIWVYSEPGLGTTFKIYLPRLMETPITEEHAPEEERLQGTETVLLVDDEPLVRDIAARILRAQGYRVLEASNGPDALHVQREWPEPIDLLVTDVVMPLMSGKELAQRLLEARPDIKVLYV